MPFWRRQRKPGGFRCGVFGAAHSIASELTVPGAVRPTPIGRYGASESATLRNLSGSDPIAGVSITRRSRR